MRTLPRPFRTFSFAMLALATLTVVAVDPVTAVQTSVPPAGGVASAALAASPRHGEWAEVDAGPAGTVQAWVVYPERADSAPVVVVIHEIFGMSDWVRSVADAFAAEGFIAIAPDLLSGKGPDGGGTASIENPRQAISQLDTAEVKLRLDAVAEYAMALPAATDRFGVVGFCWGGSTTFRYATEQAAVSAAVVYYGGAPDADQLRRLTVPVLGLYGGDDARVNATIDPARALIDEIGGSYGVEIYDGAGHGFLRAQDHEERGEANTAAARQAWPRTIGFFQQHLENR